MIKTKYNNYDLSICVYINVREDEIVVSVLEYIENEKRKQKQNIYLYEKELLSD